MAHPARSNLFLGLFFMGFAIVLMTIWIPLDTQTGLIEKVRRQINIGDALAPTIAGLFLLIGGLILVFAERNALVQPTPKLRNLGFTFATISIIFVSLFVMRWAGPAVVWVVSTIQGSDLDYRLLRDTVPWKYIGYLLGGTLMITGMVALIEGQLRFKILLTAIAATFVMIVIYDVPFDDLLLPPNGDV